MEISFALGLAETGEAGDLPHLPVIGDATWSSWRQFLKTSTPSGQPLFTSERVALHLGLGRLDVDAVYHLYNPSPGAQTVNIEHPILISQEHLPPATVLVNDRPLPVIQATPRQVAVRFPVLLAPHGLQSFTIRYQQRLRGSSARYMVTSARRWERPLDRAVFMIDYPASWSKFKVSYPVHTRETKYGRTTLMVVEQPFLPDREVIMRWAPP